MASKTSGSLYVDGLHPVPSAGLFPHTETNASVSQMCEALVEFGFEPTKIIKDKFTTISNNYWEKKGFADRATSASVRSELAKTSRAAAKLADQLESVAPTTRGLLFRALGPAGSLRPPQPELLSELVDALRRVSKASAPPSQRRGALRTTHHVDYAVRSLAYLWISVSRAEFVHSLNTARGTHGEKEFVSRPALFVQRVAKALDPALGLQPILTSLKKGAVKQLPDL
jgi:hypothetical protein